MADMEAMEAMGSITLAMVDTVDMAVIIEEALVLALVPALVAALVPALVDLVLALEDSMVKQIYK